MTSRQVDLKEKLLGILSNQPFQHGSGLACQPQG